MFLGLVHEKGKTFGMYAVSVTKKYENGHRENWHAYRRYSDFHDLHTKIKEKVEFLNLYLLLIESFFIGIQ